MEHALKTDTAAFEALCKGDKTHELRKDDRDFQVGDTLRLRETRFSGAEMAAGAPLEYTGREEVRRISHILRGYGLVDGWVVLSCHARPQSVLLSAHDCSAKGIYDNGAKMYRAAYKCPYCNTDVETEHVSNCPVGWSAERNTYKGGPTA